MELLDIPPSLIPLLNPLCFLGFSYNVYASNYTCSWYKDSTQELAVTMEAECYLQLLLCQWSFQMIGLLTFSSFNICFFRLIYNCFDLLKCNSLFFKKKICLGFWTAFNCTFWLLPLVFSSPPQLQLLFFTHV